ncbi:MAG: efflux RND transporter periplasmic adaptor subunit, partial [Rhodothermales bacterium]
MPRSGILLVTGILLSVVLVSGCADDSVPDQAVEDVAPPPSVTPAAEPSAAVRLSPAQARDLAVQTITVQRIDEAFEAVLPGSVLPSPEHFALVSAPIAGRVSHIWAHEGERVERGAPLAELESLEFANLAADFVQARAEANYVAGEVERLETLVAQKITPRSRLDRARADLTRADAMVRAATARLRTLGIDEAQMESWTTGSDDRPNLVIRAPISGSIDRHLIDLGQSVTAYQEMMSIVDPSAVLIRGYLSPEDASAVHPGNPVCIEVNDVPDCVINTTVTTVNPSVDPEN